MAPPLSWPSSVAALRALDPIAHLSASSHPTYCNLLHIVIHKTVICQERYQTTNRVTRQTGCAHAPIMIVGEVAQPLLYRQEGHAPSWLENPTINPERRTSHLAPGT